MLSKFTNLINNKPFGLCPGLIASDQTVPFVGNKLISFLVKNEKKNRV